MSQIKNNSNSYTYITYILQRDLDLEVIIRNTQSPICIFTNFNLFSFKSSFKKNFKEKNTNE